GRVGTAHHAQRRRGDAVLGKCRVVRSLSGAILLHRRAASDDGGAWLYCTDHAAQRLFAERGISLLSHAQARPSLGRVMRAEGGTLPMRACRAMPRTAVDDNRPGWTGIAPRCRRSLSG